MRWLRKAGGKTAVLLGAVGALYIFFVIANGTLASLRGTTAERPTGAAWDAQARACNRRLFLQGRRIFRFDTFGDQAFWGGQLQLHRAIAGRRNGGVGHGVSPAAFSVGLKVDATKIPRRVAAAVKAGKVNLNDPKVTVTLLKLGVVVGVKGFFKGGRLTSMGLTCAVCHSTVDDSFARGIGRRLDGSPNRDLNVGAIVSLAPNKEPITGLLRVGEATLAKVLKSWGLGKFDAEVFMEGKAFRPDGGPAATLIPPAFGLAGINLHTYTGWGSITYWNAFVANLEMHGIGNFEDDRLDNDKQFPIAARERFGHVRHGVDRISPKLGALHFYQLALTAPRPPRSSFDAAAAARGRVVFNGQGRCQSCHVRPLFSDAGWNLHAPREICTDAFQANRSPTFRYRTTPLKGLFAHAKGGFYHDGRFPNLRVVVNHYDGCMNLGLSTFQKADLVQYLKSL